MLTITFKFMGHAMHKSKVDIANIQEGRPMTLSKSLLAELVAREMKAYLVS